jgi:hypothetical protein
LSLLLYLFILWKRQRHVNLRILDQIFLRELYQLVAD